MLTVTCPCYEHKGEHVDVGRHEVTIAVTFATLHLRSNATRKVNTIIDLLLAGF